MTGAPHVEARWWGSTGASVAAHTLLFVVMMLIATLLTAQFTHDFEGLNGLSTSRQ